MKIGNMQLTEEQIKHARNVSLAKVMGVPDSGRRITICCPLPSHQDNTASCTLYPDGSWHCYGCDEHGQNAIDLLVKSGVKFDEAVKELLDL